MKAQEIQDKVFYSLISDIIETDDFRKMQAYKHHLHGTTYTHSIKVAYLCYRHYQKHKSTLNINELIRGALLHDYYLYDWRDKSAAKHINGFVHGFMHPKLALENALQAYPDLTETEQDMIERHMFPLTPFPPKTRCGWLVCFYDKVAALGEYCSMKEQDIKPICPSMVRKDSVGVHPVDAA